MFSEKLNIKNKYHEKILRTQQNFNKTLENGAHGQLNELINKIQIVKVFFEDEDIQWLETIIKKYTLKNKKNKKDKFKTKARTQPSRAMMKKKKTNSSCRLGVKKHSGSSHTPSRGISTLSKVSRGSKMNILHSPKHNKKFNSNHSTDEEDSMEGSSQYGFADTNNCHDDLVKILQFMKQGI